jgi:hypothetical protein
MDDNALELLLRDAAHKGARQVLKEIGLADEDAVVDVRELRGLLEAWRSAKKTAGQTVIKMLTVAFLTALAIGAWVKFGGNN